MIVLRFLWTCIGWLLILFATMTGALLIGLSGDTQFSENVLKVWSRVFLAIAGARVAHYVDPAIEKGKSYVYVSNHTSNLDVPIILPVAPNPMRFIAKHQLQRIPLFGWAARRMGHVFINRKDSRGSALRIRARIERGLTGIGLFFFAEGTRSTTREMLPFKKGAAIAAIETGLDCVPIAIAGARDVLKPKGFAPFQPGVVSIVFGAPISTKPFTLDTRDALVAAQRAAVEKALEKAESLLIPDRVGDRR